MFRKVLSKSLLGSIALLGLLAITGMYAVGLTGCTKVNPPVTKAPTQTPVDGAAQSGGPPVGAVVQ